MGESSMTSRRAAWDIPDVGQSGEPGISLRLRAWLLRFLGHQTWIPRGRTRAVNMLWKPESGRSFPFEVDFFGTRYRGNLCHFVDWLVFTYGASCYEELTLLQALASELRKKKSKIAFFDIGANVGHHSLFMAKYADEIYAFEPFPLLQAKLQEKLALNQITNVRMIPFALGQEDEVRYYYPGNGTNSGIGTFIPDDRETYGEPIEIGIRDGDRLFSDLNLPPIDLMKIDVEGFEPLVFCGLAGRIQRDRPPILLELNERSRSSFGSEEGFRKHFWEGAVVAEVSTRRPGCVHELKPFRYQYTNECLVVPPEMADFVLSQLKR
jgi:FkbM family methyltransferase